MDQQQAIDHLKSFDHHWGEGKVFDLTVTSNSNGMAPLLLTWLNHPDKLTTGEKITLVNSLQPHSIGIEPLTKQREEFKLLCTMVLPELRVSLRSGNMHQAETLIDILERTASIRGMER